MTLEIQDKPAETGIKLNNIITTVSGTLICTLLLGVWTTLGEIEEKLNVIDKASAVNMTRIVDLEERFNRLKIPSPEVENHIRNPDLHCPCK